MSKKHFIALANAIREHNRVAGKVPADISALTPFDASQLDTLATAFKHENSNFNRERWLAYIAGECGPNGGAIK